jgi:phenylpropionate dioxygenase-like ring-hydroxylating dioxygenase large terminal subunit
MGESLVLWRDEAGLAHCLIDRCCHRGVALSAGVLVDGALQCPFHGLEYTGDGTCRCIPANSRAMPVPGNFRVPSYPVHEAGGWLWIWWGNDDGTQAAKPASDPAFADPVSSLPHNAVIGKPPAPPAWFDDIPPGMRQATVRDPWKAHYSRVAENQLDPVHVPFVHHNTIGRGNRTVVDGPGVKWIGERMFYTYVFNRKDDGTPPRKPTEVPIPPPGIDFKLEFIMPNLWQNRISESLRIVAAFVPVEADRTILYLRTYQSFMRVPVLSWLVMRLFGRLNLVIAHQDRRVVQTQVPKPSRLKGGEQLFQGDLPIVEYRKKRQEHLDKA